jgi:hypothetical protein
MHHLSFGARGDETELCNAPTDQCDTRAIWCAFRKSTKKGKSVR